MILIKCLLREDNGRKIKENIFFHISMSSQLISSWISFLIMLHGCTGPRKMSFLFLNLFTFLFWWNPKGGVNEPFISHCFSWGPREVISILRHDGEWQQYLWLYLPLLVLMFCTWGCLSMSEVTQTIIISKSRFGILDDANMDP